MAWGFIIGIVIYSLFVFGMVFPELDRNSVATRKQYEIDRIKCESKNGVAIRSPWDGSLADCKFNGNQQ